ncbi:MAG: hypothetical protein LUQ11_11770, partial [Methylococcaceae bacterium]|nr:hypothetical protein [Methylococcaceae bacterium]
MFQLRQTIAIVFSILSLSIANAETCTLNALAINPIAPGQNDIFIGKSNLIELQFKNEKTEGIVEVFPEPPLTIKNQKLKTSCSIDGGIWVRKSVFISNNDSVIVTQEYSGSNDFLIFYNTENCKKIAEIDVSNSSFEIN